MKKVIIIGASGSLSLYVINALKPLKDVHLTLFVRSKTRLQKGIDEGCEPERGTAISRKSIAAFVATVIDNPALHKKENLGISKPK